MSRLIVVSNRVAKTDGANKGSEGGLAVGVMAAMEKAGGVWFGWSGKVDNRDEAAKHEVKGNIEYITVNMRQSEYNQYYKGYANSVLWPLFHQRPELMQYSDRDLSGYIQVNKKFADELLKIITPTDTIWIHDYHLIPLGKILREAGVRNPIGFFLHTPFPSIDLLRTVPGYKNVLESLLHYDLVGFQTEADHLGFCMGVGQGLGGEILKNDRLRFGDRHCTSRVYPISVETQALPGVADHGESTQEYQRLYESLGDRKLLIGVDRLDYSKGLVRRFQAYDRLLGHNREFLRQVVYLQISPTSRGDVQAYGDLAKRIDREAGHIIGTYADFDWMPLRYLNRGFRRKTILAMYRLAHVGLVTPLKDGMNLVAKEYVVAQNPKDPGVLVLSELAGAADELDSAVIVNPYDVDGMAGSLAKALRMPLDERIDRWQRMMSVLEAQDIHAWQKSFLTDLKQLSDGQAVTARAINT
ncbi:trehalose-6-phosphate synthase [Gilvimarinus agarilyticus]|uniref:alpha,alpha-trehalose-phosphate synthase (UDP-forming) n=1 Tax=unclassified Gilvimarinus TaxID=2642066 RepID=UPI001C08E83A|nr:MULTISPECIES: trehalose-6-phosphate synthase [unclassified Gilvimarinus]MBU2885367.1 trehalose-6-phosphate synthase [Gilvimarinus agarilyticus]MDO6570266.1 trehalose-6-phosphate synthase [Gilvimarinus sp. 2_MG-2023]MDO6746946.1 trehalose-6-phosphate synthase [Gilvimarinus sp. 1_MG-2023]